MRAIGMAERTLDVMIARVTDPSRRTFGRILARHGTVGLAFVHGLQHAHSARLANQ